jgi:hypothetical protein
VRDTSTVHADDLEKTQNHTQVYRCYVTSRIAIMVKIATQKVYFAVHAISSNSSLDNQSDVAILHCSRITILVLTWIDSYTLLTTRVDATKLW